MDYDIGSGSSCSGIVLHDNDSMKVHDGGIAVSAVAAGSDCSVNVSSQGMISGASITCGDGGVFIYAAGSAYDTSVQAGWLYVLSGGLASRTSVNSGYFKISGFGSAVDTVLCGRGSLFVGGGARADGVAVSSGASVIISQGGIVSDVSVGVSGMLNVLSGGYAGAVVEDGGYVAVSSGAAVDFASHTVSSLQLSSRSATVHSGTEVLDAGIGSYGRLEVYSGGIVSSASVKAGGSLTVLSGGMVSSVIEDGGFVSVGDGAEVTFASHVVNGLSLRGGGSATLHSGTVLSGGSVLGGILHVSGGFASGIMIDSGGAATVFCGEVSSARIGSDAMLRIESGGYAAGVDIGYDGCLNCSGGTASSVSVLKYGSARVYSGGTVSDAEIRSGGGMTVFTGGVVGSATVDSGGCLIVSSGGMLRGALNISSGAVASVSSGAIIDFTVAEQVDPDIALINDWSRISGKDGAVYTLTVGDDQVPGSYQLAGGASGFYNAVTVKTSAGDAGPVLISSSGVLDYDASRACILYRDNHDNELLKVDLVNQHDDDNCAEADKLDPLGVSSFFFNCVTSADTQDYRLLSVDESGRYDFILNSLTDQAQIKVRERTDDGLVTLKSATAKSGGSSAVLKNLELDASGIYYAEINAVNDDTTAYKVFMQKRDDTAEQGADWNALVCNAPLSDFVGAVDAQDYRMLSFDESGKYDFTVSGLTGQVQIKIYEVDGEYNKTYVKSRTVAAGKESDMLKGVELDAEKQYCVAVLAVDGQDTAYALDMQKSDNTVKTGADWTALSCDVPLTDFVGGLDAQDYRMLSFDKTETGAYKFTVSGLEAQVQVKICEVDMDESGRVLSKKTVKSKTIAAGLSSDVVGGVPLPDNDKQYCIEVLSVGDKDTAYSVLMQKDDDTVGKGASWTALSCDAPLTDFVGGLDAQDYRMLSVDECGKYDFTVSDLTSPVQIKIYALDEECNKTFVAKSTTGETGGVLKNVCLDSENRYCVEVLAVNGQDTGYKVEMDLVTPVVSGSAALLSPAAGPDLSAGSFGAVACAVDLSVDENRLLRPDVTKIA